MDRLDAMRLFVRVSELGSFTAAARQLGVARSVVTRQVAALEKHLGARLLTRTTRRVSVTPAGADYARRSRDILALVEAAETGAADERLVPVGRQFRDIGVVAAKCRRRMRDGMAGFHGAG